MLKISIKRITFRTEKLHVCRMRVFLFCLYILAFYYFVLWQLKISLPCKRKRKKKHGSWDQSFPSPYPIKYTRIYWNGVVFTCLTFFFFYYFSYNSLFTYCLNFPASRALLIFFWRVISTGAGGRVLSLPLLWLN